VPEAESDEEVADDEEGIAVDAAALAAELMAQMQA
jgi:hypothetical protein